VNYFEDGIFRRSISISSHSISLHLSPSEPIPFLSHLYTSNLPHFHFIPSHYIMSESPLPLHTGRARNKLPSCSRNPLFPNKSTHTSSKSRLMFSDLIDAGGVEIGLRQARTKSENLRPKGYTILPFPLRTSSGKEILGSCTPITEYHDWIYAARSYFLLFCCSETQGYNSRQPVGGTRTHRIRTH